MKRERVKFRQGWGRIEILLQESDDNGRNWQDVRTLPWEERDNGEIIAFYSPTVQLKYCPKEQLPG